MKPTSKKHERLYQIWSGIKQRCNNPKCNRYQHYGAKGIKMCETWAESYQEFANWAYSNGYADNLSIDRIDSNQDYCPQNCRWIPAGLNASLAQAKRYGRTEERTRKDWYNYYHRYHTKCFHQCFAPARPTRNGMYIKYFRALEKDV